MEYVIAGTISLIVSLITNYVYHKLETKKEKNIRLLNLLKEFYFPVLPTIKSFINTQTAYRKGHDTKKIIKYSTLRKKVTKLIKNNFSNINYKIFKEYLRIKSQDLFEDFSGIYSFYSIYKVIYILLEECMIIIKQIPEIDDDFYKDIQDVYLLYYLLYHFAHKYGSDKFVLRILSYKYLFKEIGKYEVKKIKKYIKVNDNSDIDLKKVINILVKNKKNLNRIMEDINKIKANSEMGDNLVMDEK